MSGLTLRGALRRPCTQISTVSSYMNNTAAEIFKKVLIISWSLAVEINDLAQLRFLKTETNVIRIYCYQLATRNAHIDHTAIAECISIHSMLCRRLGSLRTPHQKKH